MARGSGSVARLYVDIQARMDQLNAGLRKAEAATRESQRKIQQAGEKVNPFGGIVGAAAKVLTVMGSVELSIKAVNAAFDLAGGNVKSFVDELKQLPAGIGPVIQALDRFDMRMRGELDTYDRITAKEKERAKRMAENASASRAAAAAARQLDALRSSISENVTREGMGAEAARNYDAILTAEKQVRSIQELREQSLVNATDAEREAIERNAEIALRLIGEQKSARLEAIRSEFEERRAEELKSLVESLEEVGRQAEQPRDVLASFRRPEMRKSPSFEAPVQALVRSSALDLTATGSMQPLPITFGDREFEELRAIRRNTERPPIAVAG